MKKLWIAAAVGCASVSGAQAQSSVTLYGRIDNGVEYMSNVGGHSRWRLASGEWGTGLFGLKGSEDLGGGNKAIFKLESGIDTSDGAAGDTNGRFLYQRYAFVGIANDTYGTFTLGRMLAISNGVWDFDPFVQQAWSSASLVRSRNWNKTSNNIQYQSPNWYGIDVLGQYSLGNTTSLDKRDKRTPTAPLPTTADPTAFSSPTRGSTSRSAASSTKCATRMAGSPTCSCIRGNTSR